MPILDYDERYKKGKLLAQGHGVDKMMDVSYKYGYKYENTYLDVDDASNLNSRWRIFEKVLQTEKKSRR